MVNLQIQKLAIVKNVTLNVNNVMVKALITVQNVPVLLNLIPKANVPLIVLKTPNIIQIPTNVKIVILVVKHVPKQMIKQNVHHVLITSLHLHNIPTNVLINVPQVFMIKQIPKIVVHVTMHVKIVPDPQIKNVHHVKLEMFY